MPYVEPQPVVLVDLNGNPYKGADAATVVKRVPRADRIAFLGDSIVGLNGTGDNVATFHNSINNFTHYLTTLLKGKAKFAGVYNTSGYRLDQIRDSVLPRLLAVPTIRQAGTVVLLGGTNDVGQSYTVAQSMQAISDIYTALDARGIRLVLCTIPPRNDSGNTGVGPLNYAIQAFAETNGLDVLPFHAALVNPATGQYQAALQVGDGVHPSTAGMKAMADAAITAGFGSLLPIRSTPTVKSPVDGTDLLGGKGLFLTDSNSDGVADNWNIGGNFSAITRSIVTPSGGDGLAGNWARTVVAAGTTGGFAYLQATGAITPGGTPLLELALRVRITGATSTGATPSIQLIPTGGATADATTFGYGTDIDGVITLEQQLRADDTGWKVSVNFAIPSTGSVTVDVGEVAVRNLTALGLA